MLNKIRIVLSTVAAIMVALALFHHFNVKINHILLVSGLILSVLTAISGLNQKGRVKFFCNFIAMVSVGFFALAFFYGIYRGKQEAKDVQEKIKRFHDENRIINESFARGAVKD